MRRGKIILIENQQLRKYFKNNCVYVIHDVHLHYQFKTRAKMEYTAKQIENAKRNYNAMLVIRTVESYQPEFIGQHTAEQRCEYHNNIVREILSGNKELEKEWKLFFLKNEVLLSQDKWKMRINLKANCRNVLKIRGDLPNGKI